MTCTKEGGGGEAVGVFLLGRGAVDVILPVRGAMDVSLLVRGLGLRLFCPQEEWG